MLPAKSVISPVNERFICVVLVRSNTGRSLPFLVDCSRHRKGTMMHPDLFLALRYRSVLRAAAPMLQVICHFPTVRQLFF